MRTEQFTIFDSTILLVSWALPNYVPVNWLRMAADGDTSKAEKYAQCNSALRQVQEDLELLSTKKKTIVKNE